MLHDMSLSEQWLLLCVGVEFTKCRVLITGDGESNFTHARLFGCLFVIKYSVESVLLLLATLINILSLISRTHCYLFIYLFNWCSLNKLLVARISLATGKLKYCLI